MAIFPLYIELPTKIFNEKTNYFDIYVQHYPSYTVWSYTLNLLILKELRKKQKWMSTVFSAHSVVELIAIKETNVKRQQQQHQPMPNANVSKWMKQMVTKHGKVNAQTPPLMSPISTACKHFNLQHDIRTLTIIVFYFRLRLRIQIKTNVCEPAGRLKLYASLIARCGW